jgi:hypothetical protein
MQNLETFDKNLETIEKKNYSKITNFESNLLKNEKGYIKL